MEISEDKDKNTVLGDTVNTWNYRTSEAYFALHPKEHLKGKSLIGLFYSREDLSDAQLMNLPIELAQSDILTDLINLYDMEFLTQYNRKSIKLEEKQFVLLVGEGQKLVDSFHVTIDLTMKQYSSAMIPLLNFWNKYDLQTINRQVKKVIDRFIAYIIGENDVFWGNLKDDLTWSLGQRKFKTEEIIITENNKQEIFEMKRIIEGMEKNKLETNEKMLKKENDYRFFTMPMSMRISMGMLSDDEKKYVDISEFIIKPLQIENYYGDLSKDNYNTIFQSCTKINKAMPLRLFAAVACSYNYYHFNLNKTILDSVNRLGEPLIVSLYTRYLLYLAYKDETIFKTRVTENNRHVISQDVACRLRMILRGGYSRILPANGIKVFPNQHENLADPISVSFDRGIYNIDEFHTRMQLFSGKCMPNFDEIKSALSSTTSIYITGSIMTACGLRVPRKLTVEEKKLGKILLHEEIKWYKEHYKNSDIDIAIFAQSASGADSADSADGTVAFTDAVKLIYNNICKQVEEMYEHDEKSQVKLLQLNKHKYRIITPSTTYELFRLFYDNPCAMIYNFHMPSVRAFYNPISSSIMSLPSYIYAGVSGYQIDYRYFASETTQLKIIEKNVRRGFYPLINVDELYVLRKAMPRLTSYPQYTAFHLYEHMQSIANITARFLWSVDKSGNFRGCKLGKKLNSTLFQMKKSLFNYSISASPLWNRSYNHVTVPNYPASEEISAHAMHASRTPIYNITGQLEDLLQIYRDVTEELRHYKARK
jgi:hypothetical protein